MNHWLTMAFLFAIGMGSIIAVAEAAYWRRRLSYWLGIFLITLISSWTTCMVWVIAKRILEEA